MEYKPDIFIYNPLEKEVKCKAFGNWFNFAPGKYKLMRHEFASWLAQEKKYLGLVTLGEEFSDPAYVSTEEGKTALEAKRQEGINNRVRHLKAQVDNLNHSLINDLRAKDMTVDPNTAFNYATDGDLEAMDELFTYQKAQKDKSKERADAAKLRMRQLNSVTSKPTSSAKDEG